MNVIRRTVASSAYTKWPNRPFRGVVLHHSAGTSLPTPARGASWHYAVMPDGTLYGDVPEEHIAHHCGATDRWRPAWVPRAPNGAGVSDINYASIGIEIIYAPQLGQSPTDAQRASVNTLLDDLRERRGLVWVVGHGECDLSKWPTEPHNLDWQRTGLTPNDGINGHQLIDAAQQPQEAPDVALTDAQQRILDAAVKWNIDDGGALDFYMGTRQTLAEQKESLEHLLASAQGERDAYMAETARLQQALSAAQAAPADPATVQALRDRLAQIAAEAEQIKQLAEVPA